MSVTTRRTGARNGGAILAGAVLLLSAAAASAASAPSPSASAASLPLSADLPADGAAWAIRVGGEVRVRAALQFAGAPGETAVLEVRDPSGGIERAAAVANIEVIEILPRGRTGFWTFSLRPAASAAAAATRRRIRFDALDLVDRGLYPPPGGAASARAENPSAAPFAAGASGRLPPAFAAPPASSAASAGPTPDATWSPTAAAPAEALVAQLESAMTASRGGRIDQEGMTLLLLLRKYLRLPPPRTPPTAWPSPPSR